MSLRAAAGAVAPIVPIRLPRIWPNPLLGLGPRWVALVLLAALATGGLVGTVSIARGREALRREVLDTNLAAAELAADYAAAYVRLAQGTVRLQAARSVVVQPALRGDWLEAEPPLLEFVRLNREVNAVDSGTLVDATGVARVSGVPNNPQLGRSLADAEWFPEVLARRAPYLGLARVNRATGRPIVPYVIPMLDDQRTVRAVFVTGISLAGLADSLDHFRTNPGARTTLIDLRQTGAILAHVDRERILQPLSGDGPMMALLAAGERGAVETVDTTGERTLAAFAPVPGLPWGVLVQVPVAEAYAPLDALTRELAVLILAALALAGALAAWLAMRTTRPLRRLHLAVEAIGAGDLGHRVGMTSADEVGDLGRAFDQMAAARQAADQAVRVLNAELESTVKELEAFSYTVSHDLRAPLRHIDGFARILIEDHLDELSPEAQAHLQVLRQGAQQMGRLIDDLLAFSRLSRQSLKRQWVDPTDLARAVLSGLADERANREVEAVVAPMPACSADPALLRQVYANLLANALKFTRRRERARVEVGAIEENGETVYLVRDNGAGFDMRYADKLFGVFQRLHRAGDFEGTGVGLAIVQRIVHRHGGRIWAEGAVDRGATFYFTLGSAP